MSTPIIGKKFKCWHNHEGKLHRGDGPAVIYFNGGEEWWVNGKLHRVDGPTIIYSDGTKYYYINGKYHRGDGPAIIYSNGKKFWFINGKQLTKTEYNKWFINKISKPNYKLTSGDEKYFKELLNE